MTLSLLRDVQQLIDEQVKAGHFPSPEAVVEAAIIEMRRADDEFDSSHQRRSGAGGSRRGRRAG